MIVMKWSRTMQNNNQIKLLTVPRIYNFPICPVCPISNLVALTLMGASAPLFRIKYQQEWIPLTDTMLADT